MSAGFDNDVIARYPFLALVRRELTTLLRTRRIFFGLLTLSIVCAWIVLNQWPYGDAFVWSHLVRSSESLFNTFAMLALTGGPLVVAAIAAGSLVGERERDSWDLLQLSLISRVGVVAGKLLGPFAMFALTLTVCAPIFAALLFLAGLDFERAGQTLALILGAALTSSAIALASSARARRTVTATTLAFFSVALFMGLAPGIVWLVVVFMDEVLDVPINAVQWEAMFITSPYFILGLILQETAAPWAALGAHFAVQGALFALCLGYCAWAIGRGDLAVVEEERPRRSFSLRLGSNAPVRSLSRPPIPDRSNPIFLREVYWASPLSTRRARRVAAGLFVFAIIVSSAIAYLSSTSSSQNDRMALTMVATFIVGAVGCLYVPVACASAYTKELAISNFDLLRGTLLKPHEIVWGKCFAAMVLCLAVWLTCVLATLPVSVGAFDEPGGMQLVLFSYGSLFAALVEGAAASLLVSFHSRRGGAAIIGSYLLVFMLYFGFFVLALLAAETLGLTYSDRGLRFRSLVILSPVMAYFWTAIESLDEPGSYPLIQWLLSLTMTAAFVFAAQLWTIGRFHARIEKLGDR